MAINNNCDGIIEVNFSSYIVVNSTMNVIDYNYAKKDSLDTIPVYISVNAQNLYAYVEQEPYCPTGGIQVPDPCNSGTSITVPCVTLNEVRVSGPINFVVGVSVVDTTGRATDNVDPGVKVVVDPTQLGTIASSFGSAFVNDEVLLYLDDLADLAPTLKVIVQDLIVSDMFMTNDGDYCFEVTGKFVIEEDVI